MNNFNENQKKILNELKALRLHGMIDALQNQFNNEHVYSAVSFDQRLEDLITRQIAYKDENTYRRLLHQGKLKFMTSFNDLHFSAVDGISEENLHYLISNNWLFVKPVNIIIQGPCGVGKSSLACCLLNGCAREGASIRFYKMNDLAIDILIATNSPSDTKSLMNSLVRYKVLCLDDFGCEKLDPKVISFLYNLIDARWESKPIIITSQLKIEAYAGLLGGNVQAEAIVDRLLRPAKIITMEGDSKRTTLS